MKIIGIAGGSSLCELGPAADVQLFFECIQSFAVSQMTWIETSLLTDRLYKRYLRENEIEQTFSAMQHLKEVFRATPTSFIDLSGIGAATSVTRLDPTSLNLLELFCKYFECFEYCKESAELFLATWKILQPVRLVIADTLDFIDDKKRPLIQYDSLEGRPFWLRHLPQAQ